MSLKVTRELIHKLPKSDLHVHLDGSVRISTLLELAASLGVQLPAMEHEELAKLIVCGDHTQDLEDYLRGFHIVNMVLQTPEALSRAAYELAEDAAGENVRYIEVRYSPILHTGGGMTLEAVSQAVIDGLRRAEQDFEIKTGVIICGIRNMPADISLRLAQLAVEFQDKGVVGFDLAGGEYQNPAIVHRLAFELVRQNNMNLTIHAGEASGAQSIHQALHLGGAHRIGHGTRLIEDPALMDYVNDHRIPLEVCLKSNVHTKAVADIGSHPFPHYLESGLRVTLNTDNRVISDTSITDEYMLAVNEYELDYPRIKRIILNGFKSAFLPYPQKVRLIRRVLKELEQIELQEQKAQYPL